MKKVSFNTANFVAHTSDYAIHTEEWSVGERSTSESFKPIETFEDRFHALVSDIKKLGFDYMDLWYAHLSWEWATEQHIEIAKRILNEFNMEIMSYVGEFGSTEEEFTRACRLVRALGFDLMGGGSVFFLKHKEDAVDILRREEVRFAFENHPNEPTIEDALRIMDNTPADIVGITIDTGWFMTYDIAPDKAVEALLDRIMHVHLKDIKEVGGHDTCAYGEGIVPLYECVRILENNGYIGHYSIEHEPYTFDPSEDCVKSKAMLDQWVTEV